MPMMRILLVACCLLLSASALAASPLPQSRGSGSRGNGGGGGGACPTFPATCQINAPTFNFGRTTMNSETPPTNGTAIISVTCQRHPQDRLSVEVPFELIAVLPDAPPRYMRDQLGGAYLAYDMYVDPARTRIWGDGNHGTEVLEAGCILNEKNRVCTIPFTLYGRVPGSQSQIPPAPYLGAVVARLEYGFAACIP
jgi:spore coat protein U-like protein